jgi:hypothetical protein
MLPVACPATLHPMRLDRLTWIRKLETDSLDDPMTFGPYNPRFQLMWCRAYTYRYGLVQLALDVESHTPPCYSIT